MTKEATYGLIIFVALATWLVGLSVIIALDSYTEKNRKKYFILIVSLVFSLVLQNYFEYWIAEYHPSDTWRTALSVYGYSIRPVILTLFVRIITPGKKVVVPWCLTALNAVMYLTAFRSPLVFSIEKNHWIGGPLHFWCLATSLLLIAYLIYLTIFGKKDERPHIREIVFHLFWVLLILAGITADSLFNKGDRWIDYLTGSIACVTVFAYIYIHQKNVRSYQASFIAEQRVKLLMSQIQPHFIYNSLSSIRSIEGNPEETKQAITEFANYIRGNLAALDGKELIPFKDELELIGDYISLQQRRFPGRINVIYDITDDDFSVPPLTMQILVENAIKHGILVRYEPGEIRISSRREKDDHVVTVSDDGVGFDKEKIKETDRVGLRAVTNRLAYFLGGIFTIESEIGKGTVATIRIPVKPPKVERIESRETKGAEK